MSRISTSQIRKEVVLTTARSGGPGGQHVNKVETKVVLRWNIRTSQLLSEEEREVLLTKLSAQLSKEGELIVTADTHRSQLKNKEVAFKKLDRILTKAFTKPKARKATKPGKAATEKRLDKKKQHSEKKKWRQKPE